MMRAAEAVLLTRVPRNRTALMQQLQLLVFRRHYWWCGGAIQTAKLEKFAAKMAVRYPITRSTRGRAYDRSRGIATVHFIVYPIADDRVAWWILSDDGRGGLNDPATPDSHMARHAVSANGHITFADYVLHYAHKKSPRYLPDRRTGRDRVVMKDVSTWTWKLSDSALNETRASIEQAAASFQYGSEGTNGVRPWGILGILICQRSRPLFSGVRGQVLDLHRYADSHWSRVKKTWQGQHSARCLIEGDGAGELRPLRDVMSHHLPKMVRIAVYGDQPKTLGELVQGNDRKNGGTLEGFRHEQSR